METLICMCLANCLCSLISLHSCFNLIWTSSNNLPSWRCLIQGSKSECIYMAFMFFIGNLPEFELRKLEGPYKVHKVTWKIANSGFFLCQLTDHFLSKWPVLSSNVDQTSWSSDFLCLCNIILPHHSFIVDVLWNVLGSYNHKNIFILYMDLRKVWLHLTQQA